MMLLLFLSTLAGAHEVHVAPYVQLATPTSVWIVWETTGGQESRVEFGISPELGQTADGTATVGPNGLMLHETQLSALTPGSTVYYRTITEDAQSDVQRLHVPDAPSSEASQRLIAMSDMQRDGAHPEVFGQIVNDGIVPWLAAVQPGPISDALDLVLIPGDLVDDGTNYDEWRETFFDPIAPISASVPVYPVYGNHERDTDTLTRYFHLPTDGSDLYPEHWYTVDHGNIRVIGLDSNGSYLAKGQLEWLTEVLEQTCGSPDIDFVFAQLHHPHKSELWRPGENPLANVVVERLSAFSTDCGKPVTQFYGHTHGYSRGQVRDHRHLLVNVASAGGAIDYWGEYPQADYDEYSVSTADYGFVVVDVQAGDDPSLTLTRVGMGAPGARVDNVVTEVVSVRLHNEPPRTPTLDPTADLVPADCITLSATDFDDPQGDAQRSAHWQVALDCGFVTLTHDEYKNRKNVYFGQDLQADDDLTDHRFDRLPAQRELCARVRYRDEGLVWSAWSEPLPFVTGANLRSDEHVLDPGAEELSGSWIGSGEIAHRFECDGPPAASGARYLAPSGACGDVLDGTLAQQINLARGEFVHLQANLWGDVRVTAEQLTDGGEIVGTSQISSNTTDWSEYIIEVPRDERASTVRILIEGVGFADDVSLQVGASGPLVCESRPEPRGCGCSSTGPMGLWTWLWGGLALALGLRLRRR